MPERKPRDDLENPPKFELENDLLKDETIELGAGCSIAFDYKEETPKVYVKTYGDVDVISLRKKLEQNYPGARIEGLNTNASTPVRASKKRRTATKKRHK